MKHQRKDGYWAAYRATQPTQKISSWASSRTWSGRTRLPSRRARTPGAGKGCTRQPIWRHPYRAWRIQRCWAHILREAKYLSEAHPGSAAARDIHKRLQRVHRLGLDAQKWRMSCAARVRLRAALLGHATRILNDHRGNPTAPRFLTKLEGADDLLEFVPDPLIDSTNNAAERGLREIVIARSAAC